MLGLGSSGSLFLRDLPSDRDLIGVRVAADSDAAVLKSLSSSEVDHRILLPLPKGYRKRPAQVATNELLRLAANLGSSLQAHFSGSPILLIASGLGGLTSHALLRSWLPVLQSAGFRIALLALWPVVRAQDDETQARAEESLCLAARHCTSVCLVNTDLLATGLPEERTLRQLLALSSALRVGHALDWERLARYWPSGIAA